MEDLSEDLASSVIQSLHELSSESEEDIDLYINSIGGSVWSAFAIIDTIRTCSCRVNTYALGTACSAATVILASGTGTRAAYKNTRIMIHEPSWGFDGKFSDMLIYKDEFEKIQDVIVGLLARATGKSEIKIRQDFSKDFWMSAEEALEYGLVDVVI